MATDLAWIDPATSASFVGPMTFSGLVVGTPSAAVNLQLWNAFGGGAADLAQELRLFVLARLKAVGGDYLSEGLQILDQRAIEFRILGGLGSLAYGPSGWLPLGSGAWSDLPPLDAGQGIDCEFRVNLLAGSATDDVQLEIKVESSRSKPLPRGVWESAGSGVLHGLGRVVPGEILHLGGQVGADGTDTITLPDVAWTFEGGLLARAASSEVLDTTDGDGAALLAGEGYIAAFTLGDSRTITRGPKAPIASVAMPALPGGKLWLWLVRDLDGIQLVDITEAGQLSGYGLRSTSGLTVRIGAGQAFAGPWHTRLDQEFNVDLPASSTSTLWLLTDGSAAIGERPDPQALELWEFDTDLSSITASRDLRRWIGRPLMPSFSMGAQVGDADVWINGTGRPVYFLGEAVFDLLEDPASLGHTSGSWDLEVERRLPGQAWEALFTASIGFDGAMSSSFCEKRTAPPGALVRARILTLPSGGSPASGAIAALPLWSS